jgi:hypothetical protein
MSRFPVQGVEKGRRWACRGGARPHPRQRCGQWWRQLQQQQRQPRPLREERAASSALAARPSVPRWALHRLADGWSVPPVGARSCSRLDREMRSNDDYHLKNIEGEICGCVGEKGGEQHGWDETTKEIGEWRDTGLNGECQRCSWVLVLPGGLLSRSHTECYRKPRGIKRGGAFVSVHRRGSTIRQRDNRSSYFSSLLFTFDLGVCLILLLLLLFVLNVVDTA